MASLRRRYQERIEASPRSDDPPVSVPPTGAAKLPDPVGDAPQPAELPEQSPADKAATAEIQKQTAALQARLEEMNQAERLVRQAQQQPQFAEPPPEPQQPTMPAHIEKWLNENPRYMDPADQIAQTELYLATLKCTRDGKSWEEPDFIEHVERHLGLRPQIQPNGNAVASNDRVSAPPAPAPRYEAPPRQQQRSVAVSAPPTREVPSMSTGRAPRHRAPLTRDELEIAAASGQTPEQYQQAKEMLQRQGRIGPGAQDGR